MNYSLNVKTKDQKPLANNDVFIYFTFFGSSQYLLHHDFNIQNEGQQFIITSKFRFRTLSHYFTSKYKEHFRVLCFKIKINIFILL